MCAPVPECPSAEDIRDDDPHPETREDHLARLGSIGRARPEVGPALVAAGKPDGHAALDRAQVEHGNGQRMADRHQVAEVDERSDRRQLALLGQPAEERLGGRAFSVLWQIGWVVGGTINAVLQAVLGFDGGYTVNFVTIVALYAIATGLYWAWFRTDDRPVLRAQRRAESAPDGRAVYGCRAGSIGQGVMT